MLHRKINLDFLTHTIYSRNQRSHCESTTLKQIEESVEYYCDFGTGQHFFSKWIKMIHETIKKLMDLTLSN